MARQEVNIGVEGNDGTGDSIRESFRKVNENFQELYAVFGIGGTIDFLDLSDTPESYSGERGKLIAVRQDEVGLEALELVSNTALPNNPSGVADSIQFDRSIPGKLVVFSTFSRVSQDTTPELGSHMNANQFAIGKVAVSDAAAQSLAASFQEAFTIEDLVINKRFAGQNYLKRGVPGISANLRNEPANANAYQFTIISYNGTNVNVPSHSLDSSSDGAAYIYSADVSPATGLTDQQVYFIRIIDENTLRLYTTATNAISDTGAITAVGGSGTQTLTDNAYNEDLMGFWLENEALPRKSVVRRQGDDMEGALYLHDHPGELAGSGTPSGQEDLQAATKYYVDQNAFRSTVNLYVNTQGTDVQPLSPPGTEGRSLKSAFASINKACQKAEEIQIASPFEAGPYKQIITHSEGLTNSLVETLGIKSEVQNRRPVKTRLEANREFIQQEVIAFIDQQYPNFVYDEDEYKNNINYILDAVILDTLSGNNANYLSRWAGIRYYSSPSAQKAVTTQLTQTIAAIQRTKLLADIIIVNDLGAAPYTPIEAIRPPLDTGPDPDGAARQSVSEKFDTVITTIQSGPLDAPNVVDGSVYEIEISNGSNVSVDQGNPINTDLLPGKLVIGKQSGAKGIIVNYVRQVAATKDALELQLVEPIEFEVGEELDFGNTVKLNQITILVEAGVYLEDYPIKVPANISIKGDEFRRTIIRPNGRNSQSRYANTYFYRDREFDGLTNDTDSITGFKDPNLPYTGTAYLNPLTGNVDGYFGYHYLLDPTEPLDISDFANSIENQQTYVNAVELLELNRDFIVEEVNVAYPTLTYNNPALIVDALIFDLSKGGRAKSLEAQWIYFVNKADSSQQSVEYIKAITASVLANTAFTLKQGTVDQVIDTSYTAESGSQTALDNLVDTIAYAFSNDYNPARNNLELDVFLLNDATRLSNITVQGHGGFMSVLDPDGQILTKSPYIQVGSSFSQSLNRKAFRGGMLVDAFTGNVPATVIEKANAFEITVQSAVGEGLRFKKPQTPAPFYVDGERFQVNAVREWDPETGRAKLFLDSTSNNGNGFTGTTNTLLNVDLDSLPIDITIQTAGNRSMLGNDFTQINDLGYGLITTNGGLSEMVSMFTYYTQAAFYAKNGGEIRSLNGSNAYGNFGLVSEGADPNEIPDAVTLRDNMIMPVRTFESEVTLQFGNATAVSLDAGAELLQATSGARGTVIFDVRGAGSIKVYLKDVTSTFNTTNTVSVDSGTGSITGTSTPTSSVTSGLTNANEQLSVYVYDAEHDFQNRSEIEIYHSAATPVPAFGRYEVANFSLVTSAIVAGHFNVTASGGNGSGAEFTIGATENGYRIYQVTDGGSGYQVGNTLTILGSVLGGVDSTNDCELEVTEISDGEIVSASVTSGSGTPVSTGDLPVHDGRVYRLSFTTGTDGFSNDGLITELTADVLAIYRQNAVFVFEDVANVDGLVIRPSTAVLFAESPDTTYRSISFSDANNDGTELPSNTVISGFDLTYAYIGLTVSDDDIATADPLDGAKTLGDTAGDTAIAVTEIENQSVLTRLNSGNMIFGWSGKLHVITGYTADSGYGIIRFTDLAGSDLNSSPITGLATPVDTGNVQLRAGLQSGATATITINISTCRATGHDFLDIGTGGFNSSNYPNVLFGNPTQDLAASYVDSETAEKGQVWERTKGRVFWVSTDQDGFFRVGRFFDVDQGTGTITFSSSIAISDLDGIGFRRGVRVTEFSTDTGMTNNSGETVPVQSAVRGYVNRRLGFNHNGALIDNPIGPGVLPRDGSLSMTGNLSMGTSGSPLNIVNLAAPTSNSDAANKGYVDDRIGDFRRFDDLDNTLTDGSGNLVGVNQAQLIVATGYKKLVVASDDISNGPFQVGDEFVEQSVTGGKGEIIQVISRNDSILGNITVIVYEDISDLGDTIKLGEEIIADNSAQATILLAPVDEVSNGIENASSEIDVTVTRSETDAELALTYKPGSIVNIDINDNAAIAQSKLAMNAAGVRANATGISQSDLGLASFDADDFAADNGWITLNNVDLDDIVEIANNNVIGNVSGSTARPSLVGVTQSGEGDKIIRALPGSGGVRVQRLVLGGNNNNVVLSLSSNTLQVTTPGGATVLTAVGTDADDIVTTIPGNLTIQKSLTLNEGLTVTEDAVFERNVDIGNNSNNDTVTFVSRVDSNIEPKDTSTYNLGTTSLRWGEVFAITGNYTGQISADSLTVSGATGLEGNIDLGNETSDTVTFTARVDSDINPSANNTYDLGSSTLRWQDVFAVDANFSGNTTLGDTDTDTVTYNARVASSINPSVNNTHDLGTSSLRWQNVFAVNANLSGSITVSSTASFNGDVNLGNGVDDDVSVNGGVVTNILPKLDQNINLGAADKRWDFVYANTFSGTATQAQYADLAELYAGDADHEPGTVVVFGGDAEVTLTDRKGDTRVAGVVSTNPAHLMNSDLESDHPVAVALQGRVPCKVLGRVQKGDLLVTSAVAGYAVVDNEGRAGAIIGKALEAKNDPGKGIIEVVVGRV